MNRIVAFLLLSAPAVTFAQCAIQPIKPIPPLGCKDLTPQCVSNNDGQSYWTWICVQESSAAEPSKQPARHPHKPEMVFSTEANETATDSVKPVAEPPQAPVTITDNSKPAAEALRMIAQQIGQCPEMVENETRWGKKTDQIKRTYIGPPRNVLWDVLPGNSVRAPYLGYVEFSLPMRYWVPATEQSRYNRTAGIGNTLDFLNILAGASTERDRYEFDLGPSGLQFIRALRHGSNTTTWFDAGGNGNSCWGKVALSPIQIDTSALHDKNAPHDPQSDAQAESFRKAAEQGDAVAQYNLGAMYENGYGVPQDYVQAALWFRKAAEQGNVLAQYALGVFFSQGRPGLPLDDAQSVVWFRKAAEQGYANAQFYLGIQYGRGHGVPEDYAEAYFWIDLGSAGKLEGIKQEDIDTARRDAASFLTKADLSHAQERVMRWLESHPPKSE